MKNIFIGCILFLLMNSCQKNFLDTKMDTSYTMEDLITNYSALFYFANAPYSYVRNEFTMMDNNLFSPVSDESEQTSTSANSQLFNTGSWNASTNPDDYYTSYYAGIRSAYYFLENSGNYKSLLSTNRDTVSTSGKVSYQNDVLSLQWYRAEAHILIAYFYFELSKRYGGVPLVTKVLTSSDSTHKPKVSYDSIINFIVNQVDSYKDSLQTNWKTSSFTNYDGRISKGMALALKARALLYWASPLYNSGNDATRWQKAASALHDVILFASGSGNYALDTGYETYFLKNRPLTSNETIWAIRYSASNTIEAKNYPIGTSGGGSGICPSQNLIDAYEWKGTPSLTDPYKNRDPRFKYSIVYNGCIWNSRTIDESSGGTDDMSKTNTSRTGYYLKKFLVDQLNLTKSQTAVHNWVFFRYGEVLLEYAEALNEAYGPDTDPQGWGLTSRQAINMVRSRSDVGMPGVLASSQSEMREAIKRERRVELAFENYRYWDLRRWKNGDSLNSPLRGIAVTKNINGTYSYRETVLENRVFDVSKMYYYPFSQTQISQSAGYLLQNTGW